MFPSLEKRGRGDLISWQIPLPSPFYKGGNNYFKSVSSAPARGAVSDIGIKK